MKPTLPPNQLTNSHRNTRFAASLLLAIRRDLAREGDWQDSAASDAVWYRSAEMVDGRLVIEYEPK
jgi:hypothetical protein